ncbi:recombinase family protein [Actinospica durhamensis]|uniref:Recombinase family protein n=1 Tax=Actinospica durhamensis TaxID=1508375 RepID=A0A941EPM4_9ACTN|nr:recombinase family protein [Actinospica durhamensis]MBR7835066.1 recombinase family protein [Actinospica durhamensis]
MDGYAELGLKLNKTPYDGCGKCWVGMIRQSSTKDTSDSPEKQESFNEEEAERHGGHIIGWAVDLDVSGATDPFDRKGLGPWLNNENGPYDGIVASAVDRIGRSLPDTTGTAKFLHKAKKSIVTRGHGVWDLGKPSERRMFNVQALVADLELSSIQERAADTRIHQREIGRKTGRVLFPYYYVHNPLTLAVESIDFDDVMRDVLEDVADRLLADEDNQVTPTSEARRLSVTGFMTSDDWRRVRRGKAPKGGHWTSTSLIRILTSPATMGYYVVDGVAGLGSDGKPLVIAEPLWSYSKYEALVAKYGPEARQNRRNSGARAPKADYLLLSLAYCGECGYRLYYTRGNARLDGSYDHGYMCKARMKGFKGAETCTTGVYAKEGDIVPLAIAKFLAELGSIPLFVQAFDTGSDATAKIAELNKSIARLQTDRMAGLYDSDELSEWFQDTFRNLSHEVAALKKLPQRQARLYWRPTGRTVADEWHACTTNVERRQLMAAYNFRVDVYTRNEPRAQWFDFTFIDQRTAVDARIETWEAYQRDMQAEAEYFARVAAEQAATEADDEQTADAFPIPSAAEQAAGLSDPEQPTRILELIS